LRRRSWTETDLAVLSLCSDPQSGAVSFGVVPIKDGRIDLGGMLGAGEAGCDAVRESLSSALEGRYLVVWAVEREASCLDGALGWGFGGWIRRTIDVRRLAVAVDGHPVNGDGAVAVARRYNVPTPTSAGPLEEALVAAQLFLIMATKLAARGERTIGDLLQRTRPGGAVRRLG
jgi:hypothetical protein